MFGGNPQLADLRYRGRRLVAGGSEWDVVAPRGQDQVDLLPELTDLRREAATLARQLNAAQEAVAEASGRDPSEQVRVTLTADGRIGAVGIGADWRAKLGMDGLAPAVLTAYREAGSRRLETWAAQLDQPESAAAFDGDEPAPIVVDESPTTRPLGRGPADESAHDAIRHLWYVLQDATDRLDELAQEFDTRARAEVTGHDPGHHVTATLTGAELTGLEISERWLSAASHYEIGSAVTEAIVAGYALADQLAQESLAGRWPFADLDRLTADPAQLLSNLGLPHPGTPDARRGGNDGTQ